MEALEEGGQVPKIVFARKCMKYEDLHRIIIFLTATPWGGDGELGKVSKISLL